MTEGRKIKSGEQVMRPRARIMRTLGDELISSEAVALIELVKNAYDADASRVLIRFVPPLVCGEGIIDVLDNGHGMSLNIIQTAWMEPATLFRKQKKRSEQRNRRALGEKGIGRFAASRLANKLELVTRRNDDVLETRVFLNWTHFDDADMYLDQVKVRWSEQQPKIIYPGGLIGDLWQPEEIVDDTDLTHGTLLHMEDLRTAWGDEEFKKLRTGLARLISPFFSQELSIVGDEFQIRLDLPPEFANYSGLVEPSDALRNPHYVLKGNVDENGSYDLTFKFGGKELEEPLRGQHILKHGNKPQSGPFYIELRVWDRETALLSLLARESNSTVVDVRRDLNDAAGINIYRDGFRVFPYGEPRNDWLRLDLRRVQNPTMRLSNNQIVGYVLVSGDKNPLLRDQSNREGLMENQSFDDLREIVEAVLAKLEERRYVIRRPEGPKQHTSIPGGLFAEFDLVAIRDLIKTRHPEDIELLNLIGEKEKELEKRIEGVQDVLSRYRRLSTLGQLIDTVLHDGRAPLSKINNEALLGKRDIEKNINGRLQAFKKLGDRFDVIHAQSDVLAAVFQKIEPFGGRKRGRPKRQQIEKLIHNAFSVLDTEITEVGVKIDLPATENWLVVESSEIQQVIINLLLNSLYWLRQQPKENRQIAISVSPTESEGIEIIFSDSGPGIPEDYREHIFDPYFSLKPNGVGLGLTISGEIVTEYYAGSLELLDKGPLPGTTFRISLNRRD
jgi:signal transduction histidine kinase